MTVDPFWFGVLMTLVAEIGFFIIGAIINTIHHRNDPEEEADLDNKYLSEFSDDILKMLEELVGED